VFEYPVSPSAQVSDTVKGFGAIKPDPLPIEEIAKNRKTASELVDKVGLNNGPQS
jgi:iron(III) transport system substrate-binding protein